jgi:hypothetical protein
MPKIRYIPIDFDQKYGSALAAPGDLSCTWSDMFWAAITVGRASWDKVIDHGLYSAYEIIYRGALLYANLEESSNSDFLRSSAFNGLDPSEKGAVSYFLGLSCAKLFAEKCLGVPWLMHVDVYKDQIKPALPKGERPDLFGCDPSGAWIIVEAKGRTGSASSDDKEKASAQAKRLNKIGKEPVSLQMGVLAHFPKKCLEVYIKDPPVSRRGRSLSIDTGTFYADYYQTITDLISSDYGVSETVFVGDIAYPAKYVQEVDALIGLNKEIYDAVREYRASPQRLPFVLRDLVPQRRQPLSAVDRDPSDSDNRLAEVPLDEGTTLGGDGVVVQLGERWRGDRRSGLPVHPSGGLPPHGTPHSVPNVPIDRVGGYLRRRIDGLKGQGFGRDFISELLDTATYAASIETQIRPTRNLACLKPVLTALFEQVSGSTPPEATRRLVHDIDSSVQSMRAISDGHGRYPQSLIQSEMKRVLAKYQLHGRDDILSRATAYAMALL